MRTAPALRLSSPGRRGGRPCTARDAAPDPYKIFANARAYWVQQTVSRWARIHGRGAMDEGGHERVEQYAADYDAVRDIVTVDPVSDYQREHPVRVRNGHWDPLFTFKQTGAADRFPRCPASRPTYSFGMAPFVRLPHRHRLTVRRSWRRFAASFTIPIRAPRPPSPSHGSALRHIAMTVAHNRDLLDRAARHGNDRRSAMLSSRARADARSGPLSHPPSLDRRTNVCSVAAGRCDEFSWRPGKHVAWTIRFRRRRRRSLHQRRGCASADGSRRRDLHQTAVRFENIHAVDAPTVQPQIVPDVGTPLEEPAVAGRKSTALRPIEGGRGDMGMWRNWQTRWI